MARRSFSMKTLILAAVLLGLGLFLFCVHPFLAINRPVSADTLVIEGWVPDYVVKQAAGEFRAGHYRKIFVSGIVFEENDPRFAEGSDSEIIRRQLVAGGIDRANIEVCPISTASFNRTSHMARAVRDRMKTSGHIPHGVNVVTMGPHARQTLLAYKRMLGDLGQVGVISYPKNDYNPFFWWASSSGIQKTLKDFAGWLKEVMVGLRS